MVNSIQLPENPQIAQKLLDNQQEKDLRYSEIGWLGKIWGVSSSIPNNVAALTIVLLLIVGCLMTLKLDNIDDITNLWKALSPFITLAFGYLCGGRENNKKKVNAKPS